MENIRYEYIIYTPTLDDYIYTVLYAFDNGYKWADGSLNVYEYQWSNFMSDTCIAMHKYSKYITYDKIRYFFNGFNNIQIITIHEHLKNINNNLLKDFV